MNSQNISKPRVALFEPRIPQNTGTIGRSCLAFDMSLDIIKPTGFSFEDKYLKRAGLDYWPYVDLNLYESFEEYKNSFSESRIIAFTKKVVIQFQILFIEIQIYFYSVEKILDYRTK